MIKIISLVLCLALGGLVLSGCSGGEAQFEEKSYTPDAQVSAVTIDVQDRDVTVELSDDGQVHIQYFESSKEFYDISVSGGVLTMTGATDKSWTDYIGLSPSAEYRKIVLQVPDAVLENLTITTTNEDITIPSLSVTGSVSLDCNGGDISFDSLDVGMALTLNVKNGDVSGTVLGSYDDFAIRAEVKSGDSSLPESKDGGVKTLNVTANNGDVNVEISNG